MEFRGIEIKGNWKPIEIRVLKEIFKPLPRVWIENNPSFKTIQRDTVLTNAPPEAPGHSKYEPQLGLIVVYDKGVYHNGKLDREQFHRSVYHELAHSIIRSNPKLLRSWTNETSNDGFVDEYAKTSPEEDFADTFSEYFIHNGAARKAVPLKANFLQKLLSNSEEKVAMDFINAFTDELQKTAGAADGGLSKILSMAGRFGKSKPGLSLMGLGAGGAIGGSLGHEKGEESGFKEGSKGARRYGQVMRRRGQVEGSQAVISYLRKRQMAGGQARR